MIFYIDVLLIEILMFLPKVKLHTEIRQFRRTSVLQFFGKLIDIRPCKLLREPDFIKTNGNFLGKIW